MHPYPYDARVQYLQGSGTQYVNTGENFQKDIRLKFNITYLTTLNNYGWGLNRSGYEIVWDRTTMFYFGNGYSSRTRALNTEYNYDLDFTAGAMRAYINNTLYRSTSGTQPTNGYVLLMGVWDKGTLRGIPCRQGVFEFYKSGVLIHKYIPVRIGRTGYFYDEVTGRLHGNSGTGAFVVGPDI